MVGRSYVIDMKTRVRFATYPYAGPDAGVSVKEMTDRVLGTSDVMHHVSTVHCDRGEKWHVVVLDDASIVVVPSKVIDVWSKEIGS